MIEFRIGRVLSWDRPLTAVSALVCGQVGVKESVLSTSGLIMLPQAAVFQEFDLSLSASDNPNVEMAIVEVEKMLDRKFRWIRCSMCQV